LSVKTEPIEVTEVSAEELQEVLERVRAVLGEEAFSKLDKLLKAYLTMLHLLQGGRLAIARLQRILFGSKSEKTSTVFKDQAGQSGAERPAEGKEGQPKKKRKGHGRNGAGAYEGAEKTPVPHPSLKPGDPCPECPKGKVYPVSEPGILMRIVGQAPFRATCYELARFRCNACSKVFQAPPPAGVGSAKYDETVASMIALFKYGRGMPFYRLEGLERGFGIPLPAGTQWDIIAGAEKLVRPAHQELVRQAAQGKVLHNDDTGMTILELCGKKREGVKEESPDRKGTFTSGIISVTAEHKIALFFTGHRHAGENLEQLLKQRATDLEPPIQMCDALSRNLPDELKTILANCAAHLRRQFVDVAESFPDECKHLLDTLKEVYKNDAITKRQGMSDDARLAFHKEHSAGLMEGLKAWAQGLFQQKLVEPNSGLGAALNYLLKHWEPLTLFLRRPGAPLDNNICEIALKRAILHRKNSMLYKTQNGARVGDVFMSLIYTADLERANPFDYLTELQRHHKDVTENPQNWLPWNYKDTLGQLQAATPDG